MIKNERRQKNKRGQKIKVEETKIDNKRESDPKTMTIK